MRLSTPCPPSPTPSSTAAQESTPLGPSAPAKPRIFALPSATSRAHSHKVRRKRAWRNDDDNDSDGSGTETQQGPDSLRAAYQRAFRRASERALTMPSSRTSKKSDIFRTVSPVTARRALSRRTPSPLSSASSSSSPDRAVPSTSAAGIGRKVAASLDLFKETAPSPSQEKSEVDAFDLPRPESSTSKRRVGASVDQVGQAQFEFVKRSDWPDREAAAIRRERSTTGLERVRTRDSISSVPSSRDPDFRKRKERTLSRRETVLSDLVQWRAAVEAGRDEDGRGRPRERSVWVEESVPDADVVSASPGSESSVSSAATFHQESRVPPSPSVPRLPASPSHSATSALDPHQQVPSFERTVSPFDLHELPPPTRRHTTRSRSPQAPAETPSVPAVPQFNNPFESPWSTDEDDESAWETASITTTTSTTSASSPFPLSPLRTSPHPQPRVHNPSDEDDERLQRAVLSNYDVLELSHSNGGTGPNVDTTTDVAAFGYSQQGLPHIPLRPFRNQVGGHSAIYKFTKRAVCKVSYCQYCVTSSGLTASPATGLAGELILRGR